MFFFFIISVYGLLSGWMSEWLIWVCGDFGVKKFLFNMVLGVNIEFIFVKERRLIVLSYDI